MIEQTQGFFVFRWLIFVGPVTYNTVNPQLRHTYVCVYVYMYVCVYVYMYVCDCHESSAITFLQGRLWGAIHCQYTGYGQSL